MKITIGKKILMAILLSSILILWFLFINTLQSTLWYILALSECLFVIGVNFASKRHVKDDFIVKFENEGIRIYNIEEIFIILCVLVFIWDSWSVVSTIVQIYIILLIISLFSFLKIEKVDDE